MNVGYAAKNLLRAVAVVALASSAGACSSVPGWMNPFGGDDSPSAIDDSAALPDQTADAGGTAPDLADVPDRPAAGTLPDSQRQVAESLAADRARAKYSAETLRGDAQAAAAPPGPPATIDTTMPDTSADTTTTASTDTSAPASDTDTPASAVPDTQTAAASAPEPPPPVRPSPRVASATPPPAASFGDGRPAVPPSSFVGGVPGAQTTVSMSDTQLGFQRSAAPPLDASVAQFVAPSILNRYRQTAGGGVAMASATPAAGSRRSRSSAMGGPEAMSGSVVANLDSLSAPSAAAPAYAPAGGSPSAVVFFPGDTTILSAAAKARVRAAAESFRLNGSNGYVRVVGHSSSRTGNMPLERHLVLIFEKSQQRANSVAQELIRDGVPADRVLVEAVGDTQPVYYESMPKGEDGNRRAEIFLQG